MNEKLKNIIIVILICIIVILTLILGFVLGMKYNNIKIDNEQKEETNKLSEDKLYEVSLNLYKKVSGLYFCGEQEIQFPNNKITSNEFSRDYINRYVIGSILLNKNIKGEDVLKHNISINEFENEFTKLFGDNVNYEKPQTFNISYIKYDLSGDNYIPTTMAMGCGTSPIGEYYLKDYVQKEKNIELTIYLLYSIGENEYVFDSNISLPLEQNIQTYAKDELLNNYEDKIIKYKYIFKMENDNYIFESIERV